MQDLKNHRAFYAEILARHPAGAIFLCLLIIYLATRTSDYYWDGITFALQIEKVASAARGPSLLFHQNHLLYESLGYALYKAANSIAPIVSALHLLQWASAVAGAAAVAIFFRLMFRATEDLYASVVSSLALGFSAIWWKMATDADAYILSLLLLMVCADILLSQKPRWLAAAIAFAGSMLIHELASLFYPAALLAVFRNRDIKNRWRVAAAFSALSWGLTVGVYYTIASLVLRIYSPWDVVKWAVSNQSNVTISTSPVGGMLMALRGNLDLVAGHSLALFRRQGGWLGPSLALIALAATAAFAIAAIREVRLRRAIESLRRGAPSLRDCLSRTLPVAVAWAAAYLAFLIFWEPWLIYYRAFYAPALALAFGLALANYHAVAGGGRRKAAALGITALALMNLAFYIAPNMRADANPLIASARGAGEIWNDKTTIYFVDYSSADTTFEYFNPKTVWRRLSSKRPIDLEAEIKRAREQGSALWLNKKAAEMVDPEWLARRSGQEIRVDGPGPSARYVELLDDR